MDIPDELTCTRCKQTKPIACFSKDRTKKRGYRFQCKTCCAKALKVYYHRYPKKFKKYARKAYERHTDAIKSRVQRYKEGHLEEIRIKAKKARDENPEKCQAWAKNYYENNSAKVKAAVKAYAQANPDKIQTQGQRKRARKAQAAINDLTVVQWQEIKAAYGHRCVYCGHKMQRLTQDHIIPISKGGNHTASNIVPACKSCNSRKHAGPPLVPVQPLLLTIASAKPAKSA